MNLEKIAPLVAIVGPTAVGKTRLAIALARQFNGEIINADSRQVYRYMDIGTAKPCAADRSLARHHLLDIINPDQDFSLGVFLALVRKHVYEINQRGSAPFLVGGSGQYIWAVLEGWEVPPVAPDPAFRWAKEQQAAQQGNLPLHQELAAIDPQRASELDPRNVRRVIRALEIYHTTGQLPSKRAQPNPNVKALIIGLTMERQALYQRVDQRFDQMMAAGLLEEVQRLSALGYPPGQGALASPGYCELGQYIAGEISLEEATQRAKFQTHRLARKQYAWFKPTDQRINWFDVTDPKLDLRAASLVEDFLSGN